MLNTSLFDSPSALLIPKRVDKFENTTIRHSFRLKVLVVKPEESKMEASVEERE